jgi:predicted N-acetyltransferase YhbS
MAAQVRIADLQDARKAARLAVTVAAYAGSQADWEQRLMRDVSGQDRTLIVATVDAEVVGYTRLGLVESESPAPDGFYLLGLVVAVTHRRHGVAEAVIGHAIQEARRRTDVLWSFFDVENGASAALHAHMGFVEQARGVIGFPGLSPDSRDVLVNLDFTRHASATRADAG